MAEQISTAVCGRLHAEAGEYSRRHCGEPMLEQRKSIRRKEQQREAAVYRL